ncbi:formylglycine-generating enzyme family protein [Paenibacillus illinoisensis]|uniref:formylglycine-generating enzyme family protein n=1 Tax=Paenibacillus illinoisensis TaxID=59845 RepID=UPI001C8D6529|nr:formylglycine-generating enzyme family protein [Paenibacillus illinoisensis]
MKPPHDGCCCSAKRHSVNMEKEPLLPPRVELGTSTVPVRPELLERMVHIKGGTFVMGTNDLMGFASDGEGPARIVEVDEFLISPHAVTNQDFAAFIRETGYMTEAERFGWSYVFESLASEKVRSEVQRVPYGVPWWLVVEGACWHSPEGKDSDIEERANHPVVHVSWNDALAYCAWSGTSLPTEAQWEYAARGGLEEKTYAWGNELLPDGEHRCNIWQGQFPHENKAEDGYAGTAPVDAYLPNGYGLYNMAGNVWEWCLDRFTHRYHDITDSRNPLFVGVSDKVSMRGGSYLCHQSYCNRYRVAARTGNTPDSSSGNCGFRVVAY